jgi:hypothetical protein
MPCQKRLESSLAVPCCVSPGLQLHLEANDQNLIRSIIEAILLRHDARRWTNAS